MKIKFNLELEEEDVIKEVFDNEDDYYTHYELKNTQEIEQDIITQLKTEIIHSIRYGNITEQALKKVIDNNKDEIISAVVDKVSKSIINNKAIKDFKKSLDND